MFIIRNDKNITLARHGFNSLSINRMVPLSSLPAYTYPERPTAWFRTWPWSTDTFASAVQKHIMEYEAGEEHLVALYPLSKVIHNVSWITQNLTHPVFAYYPDNAEIASEISVCSFKIYNKSNKNYGIQIFDTEGNCEFDALCNTIRPLVITSSKVDLSGYDLSKLGIAIWNGWHYQYRKKAFDTPTRYNSCQSYADNTDGFCVVKKTNTSSVGGKYAGAYSRSYGTEESYANYMLLDMSYV